MAEYKVKVTKTETSVVIIKAEDDEEAREIVDSAIKNNAIGFSKTPEYNITINKLGE